MAYLQRFWEAKIRPLLYNRIDLCREFFDVLVVLAREYDIAWEISPRVDRQLPAMLLGSWHSKWRSPIYRSLTCAMSTSAGPGSGVILGWVLERPVMNWRGSMLRNLKESEPGGARGRPAADLRPAPLSVAARS